MLFFFKLIVVLLFAECLAKTLDNKRQKSAHKNKDRYGCLVGDNLHNKYKALNTLGEGAYGIVVEVKEIDNETVHRAVKINDENEASADAGKLEYYISQIISKHDYNHLFVNALEMFKHKGHVCVVFEKFGPSVHDVLKERSPKEFPLKHIRSIAHKLSLGVELLHGIHISHGDIKTGNILFSKSGYSENSNDEANTDVKLIDFGCSEISYELAELIENESISKGEFLEVDSKSTSELDKEYLLDIQALGCTIYELCTGYRLFIEEMTIKFHLDPIKDKGGEYIKLYDLLKRMLKHEPNKRMKIDEVLKDPFFVGIGTQQAAQTTGTNDNNSDGK